MTASNPATDRISRLEDAIRLILTTELPETLVLDHIVVEDRTDHDGDSYFHTYIVFEGDRDKLDPAWTITLPRKLWEISEGMGYDGIPINSFVPKAEWKELQKALR